MPQLPYTVQCENVTKCDAVSISKRKSVRKLLVRLSNIFFYNSEYFLLKFDDARRYRSVFRPQKIVNGKFDFSGDPFKFLVCPVVQSRIVRLHDGESSPVENWKYPFILPNQTYTNRVLTRSSTYRNPDGRRVSRTLRNISGMSQILVVRKLRWLFRLQFTKIVVSVISVVSIIYEILGCLN